MNSPELSNELRRFITTIASIPHLEAMLLLYQAPDQPWNIELVAQRLYLRQEQTASVLSDLCETGICKAISTEPNIYQYAPSIPEMNELIDQLAQYYSRNLIEVTNMIHSRNQAGRRVQLFADAFKFNKDK